MLRSLTLTTRLALLVLLAAVGVWEPRLSLVAGFLTLVAIVSRAVGTTPASQRWLTWTLIGLALLLSSAGFLRFVLKEAIPGVIAGGRAAAEKHAIAYLRTIVAAQDYMRRSATVDTDQDKVGAAASLAELGGRKPVRGNIVLSQTPLYLTLDQWLPQHGFVASGAYLYRVCLPSTTGVWFDPDARDATEQVDEERAEREYRVYGWPKTWSPGSPTAVYVSDAYEAIQVLEPITAAVGRRFAGESAPPPCNLLESESGFTAWNGKVPRAQLPGDIAQP